MISQNECIKVKLNAVALGIAFGITEGLFMMLFAWVGAIFGYGIPIILSISSVFYGYAPSFVGGLIGVIWGFVDGFVFGIFAGWIYNLYLRYCCKKI